MIGAYPFPIVAEPFGLADGAAAAGDPLRCVQDCLRGLPVPTSPAATRDPVTEEPAQADDPDAADGAGGQESEEFEVLGAQETRSDQETSSFETGAGSTPGLMTLPQAIADPRAAGPGIYTLYKGGQRLYVGRASNLRRRLQQHLWCLTHLAAGAARYRVKLTPMRGAAPDKLGRVEAAVIDRFGRRSRGGQLTNRKAREFEQEQWS